MVVFSIYIFFHGHAMMALHYGHIDGLMQDCSNSSTLAMELLQPCAKPAIQWVVQYLHKNIARHTAHTIVS